ncbi:MAG TPA: 16S rRNA (cytosine(1402)-N(4))-methyltransferase RsmH [candidate division Zixibacteria bacterium]|nr:16S rRNA (cytosine(1402)-N(4))-methyltransferase RsmH [candidate division Zixibacteria bacterium]
MSDGRHLPVMTGEVVDRLVIHLEGAYLDLTAGLGGHLEAIAEALTEEARVYGIDKDSAALAQAQARLSRYPQLKALVSASYVRIKDIVEEDFADKEFDGILLDLGVSSLQLDDPQRGFSFRLEGPLDMRFDPSSGAQSAADLINGLDEKELSRIIRDYGEERNAGKIARAIVRERRTRMIRTTSQLAAIVHANTRPPHQNKSLARVFQAFRIAVNEELESLTQLLPDAVSLLRVEGRFAVLTYHSLEDRIIKRFFQQQVKGCTCPPEFDVCVCGNKPTLKLVNRKPITPQPDEVERNSRARSAKLRVAERI